MSNGNAPTRTKWKIWADATLLPQERRIHVRNSRGARERCAYPKTADFRGGQHVALKQRWRYRENVRVVVEAISGVVDGKQGRTVNIEVEQVADNVLVFGLIQTVHRGNAARVGTGRGRAIERRLQSGHPLGQRCRRRPGSANGRHRSASHLQDNLLPDLGMLADVGDAFGVEHQVRGLEPLVVAGHAVLPDHSTRLRAEFGGRCTGGGAGSSALPSRLCLSGAHQHQHQHGGSAHSYAFLHCLPPLTDPPGESLSGIANVAFTASS